MTRAQRWMVLAGLALLAVALHFSIGEWDDSPSYRATSLKLGDDSYYVTKVGSEVGGLVLGVLVPLVLVGAAYFLFLGWKQELAFFNFKEPEGQVMAAVSSMVVFGLALCWLFGWTAWPAAVFFAAVCGAPLLFCGVKNAPTSAVDSQTTDHATKGQGPPPPAA